MNKHFVNGLVSGLFSLMTPAFAVVPPMSNAMASARPSCMQIACAPMTPAAGPDSSMRTQPTRACSIGNKPPVDWTTQKSPLKPCSCRCCLS